MDIRTATRDYETWLAAHTSLVRPDLALKHARMADEPFRFLRATFYRWIQRWPSLCAELTHAPSVLAVGDLHVENFGNWRDAEGRLVWGINDFDEAAKLPYTNDLVRLAASVSLAIAGSQLAVESKSACKAILDGYVEALGSGGRPVVIDEKHRWFVPVIRDQSRDPVEFWQKLRKLPDARRAVPQKALAQMRAMLPESASINLIARRVAGMGSLGRPRFVLLAEWQGGPVAREAKAVVPSACVWAAGGRGPASPASSTLLAQAVRCADPFFRLRQGWFIRRLAPDCSKIDLSSLSKAPDEARLLHAMGWETANVHLGSRSAIKGILRDLRKRPRGWLGEAADKMVRATMADWQDWRKDHKA